MNDIGNGLIDSVDFFTALAGEKFLHAMLLATSQTHLKVQIEHKI